MDSSSCSPRLPLICLADKTLIPGSEKWVQVRNDVRKAFEEFGCFEASYDNMSGELQVSLMKVMEELFLLPVEAKERNVCPKPYVGYLNHDNLSESLGIQHPNTLESCNEFALQLYPNGDADESISKTIHAFSEKLVEIDVMVRKMVMESYGIEKYIDEHLNSTDYRLRLMKYVAPKDDDVETIAEDTAKALANLNINGDEAGANVKANVDVSDNVTANASVNTSVGADVVAKSDDADANAKNSVNVNDLNAEADAKNGETNGDSIGANNDVGEVRNKKLSFPVHTDKNLITILVQHEIEGLEVKTKDEKWIRVKPKPNTFIVLAGDSLCALMNGRIKAPFHRVRVTEKKRTRYTAAIFTLPKLGYIIEAPKELVDEKHPRLFRPFDYRDMFTFYHTEAGRKVQNTLQAYSLVTPATGSSINATA